MTLMLKLKNKAMAYKIEYIKEAQRDLKNLDPYTAAASRACFKIIIVSTSDMPRNRTNSAKSDP